MAYNNLTEVFAKNLTTVMYIKNVKKRDLVEQTGISPAAYTGYTHGRCLPTLSTLAVIADALGVSIGALCGDLGDINETNYYQIFKK